MTRASLVSPITRTRVAVFLAVAITFVLVPSSARAQTVYPGSDDFLQALQITGLDGPGAPKLDVTLDNIGATIQSTRVGGPQDDLWAPVATGAAVAEPDNCLRTGTVWIDSTVWYQFRPPWNGKLTVQVGAQAFRPIAAVFPYDAATNQLYTTPSPTGGFNIRGSNCAVADEVSRELSFTYTPNADAAFGAPYVRAGVNYKLQIGSAQPSMGVAGGQGAYRLILTYDPDRDGDGVYQTSEDARCVNLKGLPAYRGCPNADNDPFNDLDDDCDTVRGTEFRGCPDADFDRVPEKAAGLPGRDGCPGEDASGRDAKRNGCLDYRSMSVSTSGDNSFVVRKARSGRRIGIKLLHFGAHSVPSGSRVSLTCTRRACKSRTKTPRRGKVVFFSQKRKERRAGAAKPKNFKPGTKVVLRITNTKGLYIASYLAWRITKSGWKPTASCLPPLSSKPTPCSRVSLDR